MASTKLFDSHWIPAQVQRPWAQRKLMLVLHGRGDSLKPFLTFHRELNIPSMNYLLLNAPYRLDDGYKWCGLPPFHRRGIHSVRARLMALLDDLQTQGYLAQNIFLFGFSEGCLISCDVGMRYPQRLGGIIGVSGCIQFFAGWEKRVSNAARQTPWLITHGSRDPVIRIRDTRLEVDRLKRAGLPIEWVELSKTHVIDANEELPLIRRWVTRSSTLPGQGTKHPRGTRAQSPTESRTSSPEA